MVVQQTSLPVPDSLMGESQRLSLLMMVADGVGGGAKGAEASRLALEAVSQYVSRSMHCYYAAGADDREFSEALETAAGKCHAELLKHGQENPEFLGMATTLTLYLGVWPRAYLLQVGDSRCYLLHNGELLQITRDQTMAQELIDLGVLRRTDEGAAKLAHTLSSSIGGRPDRAGGHQDGSRLGRRGDAVQRRAHPARGRRPDPPASPRHDLVEPGVPGPGARSAGGRRQRQHHRDRPAGHRPRGAGQ
jgi:Serine/threonine protein phosphatase